MVAAAIARYATPPPRLRPPRPPPPIFGRRVATGLDVPVAAERPWGMGRHLLDDLVDDVLRGLADDADAILRGLADLTDTQHVLERVRIAPPPQTLPSVMNVPSRDWRESHHIVVYIQAPPTRPSRPL